MTNLEADTPRDASLIEKEAVAWFTRMNGRPSKNETRQFGEWLAASPEHQRAFEDVQRLWANLGAPAEVLGEGDASDLEEPLERIRSARRSNRLAKATATLAGLLAVFLAGSWLWLEHPHLLQNMRADYVTEKAERRTVFLADGSSVLLDADSALAEEMTDRERRVRLLRGTAAFSVRPSSIPFVVEAQTGEARVLGTRFDVAMGGAGDVTVTLASGSVQVGMAGRGEGIVLTPGESIDYDAQGLGTPQAVNLDEAQAWQKGRFIFTNARLDDVLRRIEQYHDGRIVLASSALGEKRVSGNISLQNPDAALAAVQASVGFQIISLGSRLTVVRP